MPNRGKFVSADLQNPRDCVYGFFFPEEARTFSPDRLTVMLEEEIRTNKLRMHLAIIGESAFLSVFDEDDEPLCVELLACVDPTKLGFKPSILRRLSEIPRFHINSASVGEVKVNLSTTITLHDRCHPDHRDEFVPRDFSKGQNGLCLSLPFEAELNPRTIVSLKWREDTHGITLNLASLHEYTTPDHLGIEPIVSATRIRLDRG